MYSSNLNIDFKSVFAYFEMCSIEHAFRGGVWWKQCQSEIDNNWLHDNLSQTNIEQVKFKLAINFLPVISVDICNIE